MIHADDIRGYVREQIIEPARQQKQGIIHVRAGDVHTAMGLVNRMPLICAAIDAQKFLDFARVTLIRRSGPHQGVSVEWVFALE